MDRHGQNDEISDLWVCLTSECTQAYGKCVKASSCLGNDVVDGRKIFQWNKLQWAWTWKSTIPHGDGLDGTVGRCGRNGRIDRIDPIGHIDHNSSHIVGLGCVWCLLYASNRKESS